MEQIFESRGPSLLAVYVLLLLFFFHDKSIISKENI